MTEPVTFNVAGPPQGKGRARSFITRGGQVGHYTPGKTRSYEGMVRFAAQEAMQGRAPMEGPVEMKLMAVMPIRASWPKKKQTAAMLNEIHPTSKPDISNVAKAVEDAMNGVVVKDDSQIVIAVLSKRYGPSPCVIVTVRPADERRPGEWQQIGDVAERVLEKMQERK